MTDKYKLIRLSRRRPYICQHCALSRGGTWPLGHVATVHEDVCPYCGKKAALACIGDWDWPKNDFMDLRD